MVTDLRLALRRLRRAPGFTAFAILTLALGIGATTSIYSVAYAMVFRPIDIKDVDRVVNLYHAPPPFGPTFQYTFSWPDVQDIRSSQAVFTDVMAWARFTETVGAPSGTQLVVGEMVSENYFTFVGAAPELGRTLSDADHAPGAADVVVLGHTYWVSQFSRDPAVLGRTIKISDRVFTIVGVMRETFRGVDLPNVVPTRLWVPIGKAAVFLTTRADRPPLWADRDNRWVFLKGRLAPGRTLESARAQITAIGDRLDQIAPIGVTSGANAQSPEKRRRFYVSQASEMHMHESMDFFVVPTARVLLVAVGLVLLVACTNIANMFLARNAGLARDLAVRRALGATRARLIRERVSESLLVAIAGGAIGLLASAWFMRLMSGTITPGRGLAIQIAPRFEPTVLFAALLSTVGAVLVFGALPAWHASNTNLRQVTESDSGGAVPRWRGRRVLIVGQVAVSVALLMVGAVFGRAALAAISHDPGFALDRLAAGQIEFTFNPAANDPRRLQAAAEQLRQEPGVESVSLVNGLPFYFSSSDASYVYAEPRAAGTITMGEWMRAQAYTLSGTSELFRTLGIPLVAGRPFTAGEIDAKAKVVVLSRKVALREFGTTSVVGRTIYMPAEPYEIVGVAEDVDVLRFGDRTRGFVYRPHNPDSKLVVLVARATESPAAVATKVRAVLRAADPDLPLLEVATGSHMLTQETLLNRVASYVTLSLGAFALAIALIGLSGLLAYLVARRRREIGVRMALGAEPRHVVRMVLRDGLSPVALGSVAGLVMGAIATVASARFLRATGLDVTGFVVVPLLLVPAALLACYLPARRAARVEPNQALRDL